MLRLRQEVMAKVLYSDKSTNPPPNKRGGGKDTPDLTLMRLLEFNATSFQIVNFDDINRRRGKTAPALRRQERDCSKRHDPHSLMHA